MIITLISVLIGVPWIGALLVWLVGDKHEKILHLLAVGVSIIAAGASFLLIPHADSQTAFSIPVGGAFGDFTFIADGLGITLSIIATVIGSLAVVFSTSYMKGEASLSRYYALILFFIGAMVGLVLSSNLLLVFFFWEITALCSYGLIAFHNDDPKAVRGGIKALLITTFGGVGLLAGALIIFAYTGSFDINNFLAVYGTLPENILAFIGFGFLIAAAAKSAQFPFQTWLPDAMEAPSPISALIHAATMVNAGVYLLARFYPAFQEVIYWRETVMAVGTLTAIMAGIMALTAHDLKRVLAYSTVGQLGFMIYAIGADSVFASQYHLLSHSIFKALLFLAAGAVIHTIGTRDMREMGGLGKKMPLVKWVFIIGALALSGVPILNGFWSKEIILEAGLKSGPQWLYFMMLLVAGLTALYTTRCVWLVFFGKPRSDYHVHPIGWGMKIPLLLLAAATLVSWLVVYPFSVLLGEKSLPFHGIEAVSLNALFHEVITLPTLAALGMVGLGVLVYAMRGKLRGLNNGFRSLRWASEKSFGFEYLNNAFVEVINNIAEALRGTQTGILNWNVLAIGASLIILFVMLVVGG